MCILYTSLLLSSTTLVPPSSADFLTGFPFSASAASVKHVKHLCLLLGSAVASSDVKLIEKTFLIPYLTYLMKVTHSLPDQSISN